MIERITFKSKYPREARLLLFSKLLERAAFYGFRSLLILYMTSEIINLERTDALEIYGWFAGGVFLFQLIGALISDLKIGNRAGLITGGILQVAGAVVICYQTTTGLFIGLILYRIGEGFYSPNLQAQFAKHYLNKKKLLDAAFSLLFLAINIGAFTGPLIIGFIGEEINYSYGFIIAAFLSLCSVLVIILSRTDISYDKTKLGVKFKVRVSLIALVFILGALFFSIYDGASGNFNYMYQNFSGFDQLGILASSINLINSTLTIFLSIVVIFIWSYFYYNPIFKLIIGFLLASIAFAILILLSENAGLSNVVIFAISAFILSIAELHISPVALSIATRYSNPKFLTTILSLGMLPIGLFNYLIPFYLLEEFDNQFFYYGFGSIMLGTVGLGLIIGIIFFRKNHSTVLDDS